MNTNYEVVDKGSIIDQIASHFFIHGGDWVFQVTYIYEDAMLSSGEKGYLCKTFEVYKRGFAEEIRDIITGWDSFEGEYMTDEAFLKEESEVYNYLDFLVDPVKFKNHEELFEILESKKE